MKTEIGHAPFEIKEMHANGMIGGFASVFGALDAQRDVVAKGAFARCLEKHRQSNTLPAMLWMHDTAEPVGIWQQMKEDAHGLYVQGKIALKTRGGGDAYELLRMGAVSGLSIGYSTIKSTMDARTRIRTLTEIDLFEVSLVTFPANAQARIDTVKTQRTAHASRHPFHDELQAIVMRLRNTASILTTR